MKSLSGPLWARPVWAQLGIMTLLLLCVMAPFHLADEVHALLPASAQHHAQIHCEDEAESPAQNHCEQPQDDISTPLSGEQHEEHHDSLCDNDSALAFGAWAQNVSVAPTSWDFSSLDWAPVGLIGSLVVPASSTRNRAPPDDFAPPPSPHLSFQFGRSPPMWA